MDYNEHSVFKFFRNRENSIEKVTVPLNVKLLIFVFVIFLLFVTVVTFEYCFEIN